MRIKTERLELIAGNLELSEAEISDRRKFSELLKAHIVDWPPPLNDENSIKFARDYFAENSDANGWGLWYFILRSENERERIVIGAGGFKGKPSPDGTVEVGYSLLERFHKQGYGSEAVRALVAWAFGHSEIERVIAETLPELRPSIRVLEKNGFKFTGQGSEPGVIRYQLTREDYLTDHLPEPFPRPYRNLAEER